MQAKREGAVSRRWFARAAPVAMLVLAGCATTQSTDVDRGTVLQGNEGVVVLRVARLGQLDVRKITVQSATGDQKYTMSPVHYGQADSVTFVGRFPAGRYQPVEMFATEAMSSLVSPLEKLTGKFDVEGGRITDLGTMIHVSLGETGTPTSNIYGRSAKVRFVLPFDPSPVPAEQLLAARFPAVAGTVSGRSALGWVAGTVPAQPEQMLPLVRTMADVAGRPALPGAGRAISGGRLGTVVERRADGSTVRRHTGAVQQVTSVLVLRDGRWLAGGEEGFLAVSDSAGQRWQRIPGIEPGEVALHLAEGPDGTLYLVTMGDGASTVYASPAQAIAFKPLRRIASTRQQEDGFVGGPRQFDSAVSTSDRLVVHTAPETLTSLDFRTGQWETQKTPRAFVLGMTASPDGLVVGVNASMWLTATTDYGRTWNRLESWVNTTQPAFVDRNRGYVISADLGMTPRHKLRRTDDGGRTWTAVGDADMPGYPGQPMWIDADGRTLHVVAHGRLMTSTDSGRSWR